jgi:hypothetical protein
MMTDEHGMMNDEKEESPPKRYNCPVFSMGNPANVNLDKALAIAADLEDDETIGKLLTK